MRYEGEFLGNLFHGFGALYLKGSKKLIGQTNQMDSAHCMMNHLDRLQSGSIAMEFNRNYSGKHERERKNIYPI